MIEKIVISLQSIAIIILGYLMIDTWRTKDEMKSIVEIQTEILKNHQAIFERHLLPLTHTSKAALRHHRENVR